MGDSNILEPLTIDTFKKKATSKQIVDLFLKANQKSMGVKIENTGRNEQSVYLSLRTWLAKHPDLGVGVQMNGGRVVLYHLADT
jgi:hypothetical protein